MLPAGGSSAVFRFVVYVVVLVVVVVMVVAIYLVRVRPATLVPLPPPRVRTVLEYVARSREYVHFCKLSVATDALGLFVVFVSLTGGLIFVFYAICPFWRVQLCGGAVRHGCGVRIPERLPLHPAAVPPASTRHAAQDQRLGAGRPTVAGTCMFFVFPFCLVNVFCLFFSPSCSISSIIV